MAAPCAFRSRDTDGRGRRRRVPASPRRAPRAGARRGTGLTKRPVISLSSADRSNSGLCRNSARRRAPRSAAASRMASSCSGGGSEVAAQQLRIEAEQPPARHVERPPVGAEMRAGSGRADRASMGGSRCAGASCAVAEIVVARQEAHRQAELIVQRARRRKIALARRAVERDVAGVQHQVRLARADRLADAHEVVDEERLGIAQMGVGDLGDAEGHGGEPSAGLLQDGYRQPTSRQGRRHLLERPALGPHAEQELDDGRDDHQRRTEQIAVHDVARVAALDQARRTATVRRRRRAACRRRRTARW